MNIYLTGATVKHALFKIWRARTESTMLKLFSGFCLGAFWMGAFPAGATPPQNFSVENVLTDLVQPMGIRFLPDGRMLVIQKKGPVRIANVDDPVAISEVYMDFSNAAFALESDQERGVLDLAIDPAFASGEPYVYVLYTPRFSSDGGNGKMRVSRFTHSEGGGGTASRGILNSEVILWEDTQGYDSCCHFGGGLDFGPQGSLWITTGDHFQGSYASSLTKAGGKVHRIRKDGSIPVGNPYTDGPGGNVDSIFAYGLRNPFRARWDLPSGRFFIGEVGGNTQSTAWEDLHVIRYNSTDGYLDSDGGSYGSINFGWPTVEGLPPHTDFPSANVDLAGEPLFAYRHSGNTSAITGGIVYRGSQFPPDFAGAYFYADSTRDFIRYLKFNPDGSVFPNPNPDPITITNPDSTSFPFDLATDGRVVALEVGPDGALYYVSFTDSGGAYGEPNPSVLGAVRRYVYSGGNVRPAIVSFTGSPVAPGSRQVGFSIRAADAELDAMTYRIDFGDGIVTLPAPLPNDTTIQASHTYFADGVYDARLEVSDASLTESKVISLAVGTPPSVGPIVATNLRPNPPGSPVSGPTDSFRYGDTFTFSGTATDQNGAPIDGGNFSWSISFVRPGNTHPAFGPASGSSINFPIPNQGQGFSGPVFYRVFLSVTDPVTGLSSTTYCDIYPEKVNIAFSSVPSGIVVQIDGNTERQTPFVLDTLINFNHTINVPETVCRNGNQHVFDGWSNGATESQQIYLVPEVDSDLSASYLSAGTCMDPGVLVTNGLVLQVESDLNVSMQSGSEVAAWLDQSGFGNDLVAQGNPQLVTDATPSGQPALSLDGVGDKLERLESLGGLPGGNGDRTMFVVAKYIGSSAWAGVSYGTGSSNRAFGLAVKHPSGELMLQGWGRGNDLVSSSPGIGSGWLVQSGKVGGGYGTLYRDGAQIAQFLHNYNTGLTKFVIGEEIAGLGYVSMQVAAVLVYNRTLSDAERASVDDYLHTKYLQVANSAPDVVITAPANGMTVSAGTAITFTATATDAEDGDLSAAVAWSSDLDGALGSGASLNVSGLSVGSHRITAQVMDSGVPPRIGSAWINLTVSGSQDALSVTSGLVMRLESGQGVTAPGGTISTWADQSGLANHLAAQGNPQLSVGSTPSGQPALSLDGVGDKFERLGNLGGLPGGNGDRTMFLVAKYIGSSAWAGVSYGTGSSNRAFGLAVKHPSGELMLQGWGRGNDLVSSSPGIGSGWLVQSGKVGGGYGTLYRDGAQIARFLHNYNTGLTKFVIGEEIAGLGYVSMQVAAVLVYNRALSDAERASVDDYLHTKYLQVANSAPDVVITAPANGATVSAGTAITFTATATDAEDGNLSAAVAWSSDLDGALGNGASLNVSGLSVGSHRITAQVTDSGVPPRIGSAWINLTVSGSQDALSVTSGLVMRLESGQGVTAPGGTISTWADQSGLANHLAAQGNPQLSVGSTPSGQPALSLDGVGDKLERLESLGGLPGGNGDRTMFVVAKYIGSSAWAGVSYGTGSSNRAFGLAVKHPSGELMLQGWGRGNDLVSSSPGIGSGWLVQSGKVGGGYGTLYRDGAQIARFLHNYNTGLTKFVIGEEIAGLGYVSMQVAAVLVYNRALSDAERASVDDYLDTKYLQAAPANSAQKVGQKPLLSGDVERMNYNGGNFPADAASDGGRSINLTKLQLGLDPIRPRIGICGMREWLPDCLSHARHGIFQFYHFSGIRKLHVLQCGNADDDFELGIGPLLEDGNLVIHYPLLNPAGNYFLEMSDNLEGAEIKTRVIDFISRAQLEGMTQAERGNLIKIVPISGTRLLFRLKFESVP